MNESISHADSSSIRIGLVEEAESHHLLITFDLLHGDPCNLPR